MTADKDESIKITRRHNACSHPRGGIRNTSRGTGKTRERSTSQQLSQSSAGDCITGQAVAYVQVTLLVGQQRKVNESFNVYKAKMCLTCKRRGMWRTQGGHREARGTQRLGHCNEEQGSFAVTTGLSGDETCFVCKTQLWSCL